MSRKERWHMHCGCEVDSILEDWGRSTVALDHVMWSPCAVHVKDRIPVEAALADSRRRDMVRRALMDAGIEDAMIELNNQGHLVVAVSPGDAGRATTALAGIVRVVIEP